MNWLFYIIFALIFSVIFTQCYKVAVRNTKNDGAATVLLQIIAGISILFFSPLYPFKFTADWRLGLLFIFACIFYALHDRLQTTARKHIEASEYSILAQLNTVFMILIGLSFFKDPFVVTRIFGAIIIIAANIILYYQRGSFLINKYMWITILATFILALGMSIDVGISQNFNLPLYIAATLFIPAIFIAVLSKVGLGTLLDEIKRPVKKFYLATGIAWGLLILFLIRSYQAATISVASPFLGTTVLLNVVVAYFFLGEKRRELRKIIAALIIVLGIYLTVLK